MSDLKETLASMKIPEHCVQGVMGEWLRELSEKNDTEGRQIRLRVLEDEEFRSRAVDAISDGIVFSTLAVTLLENDDFDEALTGIDTRHDDEILQGLRLQVFDRAISAAMDTPVQVLVDPAFVKARVDAFHEVCSVA